MCSTRRTWGRLGIVAARDRLSRRAVGCGRLRSRRPLQTYLAVFDGGDWAEVVPVRAHCAGEIGANFPEATVLEHRPAWMSVEEYERLRGDGRDLDQAPRACSA